MREDGALAQAKRKLRASMQWWIVTDAHGQQPAALCCTGFPNSNVMRTHAISARPDFQRQSWNPVTRAMEDDPEKDLERRQRSIIDRLTEPERAAMYARKEAEAKAALDKDGSIAPLILGPEAEARGMSVAQLAALVAQRAEQDRRALAQAWGWIEAKRVREKV
jgi:hypothetical protein